MTKVFLFLSLAISAAACNSGSNQTNTTKTDSATATTKQTHNWSQEDEREFLAGCVDNAKAQLGDTLAFAQCNCVLGKLKESFPSLDSASSTLMDSTKAKAFASQCK